MRVFKGWNQGKLILVVLGQPIFGKSKEEIEKSTEGTVLKDWPPYTLLRAKPENSLGFFVSDRDFSPDDVRTVCARVDLKIGGDNFNENGNCKDHSYFTRSSRQRHSLRYSNRKGHYLTISQLDERYVIARATRLQTEVVKNIETTTVPFVIIDTTNGQFTQ